LKKCLSMTSGKTWKQYHNPNLPRNPHSAFGDFPADYMTKVASKRPNASRALDAAAQALAEVSIAAKGVPTLKKGDGLGGKTVSLNKPKPKPLVQKPIAGAVNRRNIPVSEFRLFYDRGDLPVAIEHGPQNKI